MNRPPSCWQVLGLCLVSALAQKMALGQEPASFQGIGSLHPQSFSRAWDVSADGSVVIGYSVSDRSLDGSEKYEAFRWTPATGIVGLGFLAGGQFQFSEAIGLSADGRVVAGQSTSGAALSSEAFRWTLGAGMTGLGFLPGGSAQSWGTGVSPDASVIVGFGFSEDGLQAFRWTETGGLQGLGDLPGGGFFSRAWDAARRGDVVVGVSRSGESGGEAFLWTPEAGMTGLGFLSRDGLALERYGSVGYAVSADGTTIVGHSNSTAGQEEAFRWTRAEGMVGLGDLPGGEFGSEAWGVSADGSVVVGVGTTAAGEEAFIWDPVHGMRALKEVLEADLALELAGWHLLVARRVSDDGRVVVGEGRHEGQATEGWRAVLGPAVVSEPRMRRADATGDGVVDLSDAVRILLGLFSDGTLIACHDALPTRTIPEPSR